MLSPLMAFRGGGGFSYRAPVMVTTTRTRSYSYPMYVGGYDGAAAMTGALVIRFINGKGGIKGLPAFDARKNVAKLEPQLAAPLPAE